MIVGFTGTRNGMTGQQNEAIRKWIAKNKPSEFHHGDCVGADAEAHDLFEGAGAEIYIHPPIKRENRAFKNGYI